MRCYFAELYSHYRFDKAGYQQFLKEQGLKEHDIKRLNIHLVTHFTSLHFKGDKALEEEGEYYQRSKMYVEQGNKLIRGFYRPYDPPNCEYAAIYLRPSMCHTPTHLNHVLLHETRHHIQYCLKLPCCSIINAGIESEAHGAACQPWEIDAEQFASTYNRVPAFLLPIPRPPKRSDFF